MENEHKAYKIDEFFSLWSKNQLNVPKLGNIIFEILTEFHKKNPT